MQEDGGGFLQYGSPWKIKKKKHTLFLLYICPVSPAPYHVAAVSIHPAIPFHVYGSEGNPCSSDWWCFLQSDIYRLDVDCGKTPVNEIMNRDRKMSSPMISTLSLISSSNNLQT